jgi:hypothetical protein
MQFYLDSTARLPERKLSPAASFVPYRPVASAVSTPPPPPLAAATTPLQVAAAGAKAAEENASETSSRGPEAVTTTTKEDKDTSDMTTTDSEEDDSESLTTEASDLEVSKVDFCAFEKFLKYFIKSLVYCTLHLKIEFLLIYHF